MDRLIEYGWNFIRRSNMRYTTIPNTDLVVSVLCLGTGEAGANYDRAV